MTDQFYLKSADGALAPASEKAVMDAAGQMAQDEIVRRGAELSPSDLKALIPALFAGRDHEFAAVAFLDSRMRLLEFRIMAEGTLGAVILGGREVAKAALALEASNVVTMHNHPGNTASPSQNDVKAAIAMRQALGLLDICLADNWVITGTEIYSFEEHDLMELSVQTALRKVFGF